MAKNPFAQKPAKDGKKSNPFGGKKSVPFGKATPGAKKPNPFKKK